MRWPDEMGDSVALALPVSGWHWLCQCPGGIGSASVRVALARPVSGCGTGSASVRALGLLDSGTWFSGCDKWAERGHHRMGERRADCEHDYDAAGKQDS
jgi:hypothetical protein